LLDSRSVFKELQLEPDKPTLSTLISEKRRKPKADGYADGRMLMFTRLPASEFVRSDEYVALLSEASQVCGKYDQHALNEFNMQIVLDDERFDKHALTTDEIRACFKDVKVLGRRSLRDVLAWRKAMRALIAETTVGDDEPLPVAPNEDELEDEQMKQIDEQILNAKADEKSALKRLASSLPLMLLNILLVGSAKCKKNVPNANKRTICK
jgi:AdoMet-dependent rRNA methyltransferase SPB1